MSVYGDAECQMRWSEVEQRCGSSGGRPLQGSRERGDTVACTLTPRQGRAEVPRALNSGRQLHADQLPERNTPANGLTHERSDRASPWQPASGLERWAVPAGRPSPTSHPIRQVRALLQRKRHSRAAGSRVIACKLLGRIATNSPNSPSKRTTFRQVPLFFSAGDAKMSPLANDAGAKHFQALASITPEQREALDREAMFQRGHDERTHRPILARAAFRADRP
jgi:hypothetical protein